MPREAKLTPTAGDAGRATGNSLYAMSYRQGRAGYRDGMTWNPHAGPAWQAGWLDEAHLVARALLADPEAAAALIAETSIRAALDDAAAALRSCLTTKPNVGQARIIDRARLSVPDALRRLRAAHDPADPDDDADDRIPA